MKLTNLSFSFSCKEQNFSEYQMKMLSDLVKYLDGRISIASQMSGSESFLRVVYTQINYTVAFFDIDAFFEFSSELKNIYQTTNVIFSSGHFYKYEESEVESGGYHLKNLSGIWLLLTRSKQDLKSYIGYKVIATDNPKLISEGIKSL